MALINRLFPRQFRSSQALNSKSDTCLVTSKKQSNKQRGPLSEAVKNQRNSLKNCTNGDITNSNRSGSAQIRLLLFRECEVRGRRLIFDSGGGSGPQSQQFKDEFQELQLMKDMVFGSATLKYSGDNFRVHDFASEPWKGYDMMLSKVFLIPPLTQHVGRTERNRSSVVVDKLASAPKDSGYMEWTEGGDGSTCWSSGVSSTTSVASSRTSIASGLTIPRIASSRKAASDSVLENGNSSCSAHNRNRKTRLAMGLLFTPSEQFKEISSSTSVRQIVFDQFLLVEHFVQRLQLGVLRAYSSRTNFHNFIQEAISRFEKDMDRLLNAPRHVEMPVYLALDATNTSIRQQIAQQFMMNWESVVTETDTKLTRFFWSSLLSALLTYHVNWLYSFVADAPDFFDCGTRVLILSKDGSLVRRLLHVLSYFIRIDSGSSSSTKYSELSESTAESSTTAELSHICHSKSMSQLRCPNEASSLSPATLSLMRNGSSLDRRTPSPSSLLLPHRRGSQQLENTRYLRNYYDVRFQLSPDTIAKRDGKAFANLISSIAKNGFHDFYAEETNDKCAFFVGSIPDRREESPVPVESNNATLQPVQVQIPSLSVSKVPIKESRHLSYWTYGTELSSEYEAGKTLQSCDPSQAKDWLSNLQLDLRAASAYRKTVHCIVANTETWEVQVLTCVEEDSVPQRIKQYWVPVAMSGQVAAMVESTQLLWLMMHNAEQCLSHIESRLRFLCQKSEDLGSLLSTSIRSWNIDRVTRLLDIENQDLPLLMAACSIHSPSVASMGGVTIS